MKIFRQGFVRSVVVLATLLPILLAACQVTVEPPGKTFTLRPGLHPLLYRHHQDAANEAAVKQAVAEYYAALNDIFAGTVEPMAAAWSHADDVTYMGPNGAYRVGWAAVLADWEAQAALNLGGSVAPEEVSMVVGRDMAVVQSYVRGANLATNGDPVDVSLRATVSLRKETGEWKVIGVHTDLLPALAD